MLTLNSTVLNVSTACFNINFFTFLTQTTSVALDYSTKWLLVMQTQLAPSNGT